MNHFKNLFNKDVVLQDSHLLSLVIPNLVTNQINELIIMTPINDEIHQAVLRLRVDSAPGPDGFGGFFTISVGTL